MNTNYEVMYIIKPIDEALCYEITDKLKNVIAENNGTVKKIDFWGKKRLAYQIQSYIDGFYILMTFKANSTAVKKLDHALKITENVMRHMIIRKEY